MIINKKNINCLGIKNLIIKISKIIFQEVQQLLVILLRNGVIINSILIFKASRNL
jgi:hypothetical protein